MGQGWALRSVAAGMADWWLGRSPAMMAAIAEATTASRRLFIAGAILLVVQVLALSAFIVNPNLGVWAATPWRPWQSIHSCVSSVLGRGAHGDHGAQPLRGVGLPAAARAGQAPQAESRPLPRRRLRVPADVPAAPPADGGCHAGLLAVPAAVVRPQPGRRGAVPGGDCPPVRHRPGHAGGLADALGARSARASSAPCRPGTCTSLFIAAAVAAMLLFERQRHAAGGAILAYAIVSKLFPGVLLFYLLLRRDWRAVGWTAAWSVVLVAITLADVGAVPFAAFLEHLPGLLSGEAFPAFRNRGRDRQSTGRCRDWCSRWRSGRADARLRGDRASWAGPTRSSWLA